MNQSKLYQFTYTLFLLITLQLFTTSCNKYPDCEDCHLSIHFGEDEFEYNTVEAREISGDEDKFSIFIGYEDDLGVLREVLNVSGITKEEGFYSTVSIFSIGLSPPHFTTGGFRTYLSDGDVGGKSYQPDTNYTNYIEIFDWNPGAGYVEGQIVGTYIQEENHLFDADTLEITTNIFKIQLEESE